MQNTLSVRMRYYIGVIKQDIENGLAKAWYVSEGKLYVKMNDGQEYVAYDETGLTEEERNNIQ